MRRALRILVLFFFLSSIALAGAYLLYGEELKAQVQRRFQKYTVAGVVKDISTDAALELVEVYINGNPTFTNYEGKFYVNNLREFPLVRLKQEDPFEEYKFAFACEKGERANFFTQNVVCEANLVPTLKTTISRVAASFISPKKQSDLDIEHRYGYLWQIMHSDSRAEWSSYDNYATAMKQREKALWDYNDNLVSVKPYSEPIIRDSWTDLLTGKTYVNIAEVVFETTNFWGVKAYPKEHFIKSGGFWHYFGTYDEKQVNEFIKRHADWLKKKRTQE